MCGCQLYPPSTNIMDLACALELTVLCEGGSRSVGADAISTTSKTVKYDVVT